MCISARAGSRLADAERSRLALERPAAFALLRATDNLGDTHVLVHVDKFGTVWLPQSRLATFELGQDVSSRLSALPLRMSVCLFPEGDGSGGRVAFAKND